MRAKIAIVLQLVVALLALQTSGRAGVRDDQFYIIVPSSNPSQLRQTLESQYPFDILGINKDKGEVHILGSEQTVVQLEILGYAPTKNSVSGTQLFGVLDNDFQNLAAIETDLRELAQQFPEQAKLVSLMAEYNIPKTAEGREIWALRISSDSSRKQDKPRIGFVGNHHAREVQTPYAVLDTAHWLLESQTSDPRAAKWINDYEVWLVPVVNPDGYNHVFTEDPWWRKNRAHTHGVDLNRNYPFKWNGCGSTSTQPTSEVYVGPSVGSEPETQAMMALSQAEKFWISVSYHSFGQEVLYPYVCAEYPVAEKTLRDEITGAYSRAMGFGTRLASAGGEDFEWRFQSVGGITFLTELSQAFSPNYDSFVRDEIPDIRKGWFYLFELLGQAKLTGVVTDSVSGEPLEAKIEIEEIRFLNQELRQSDKEFGRFFWFLKPGQYQLKITKAGYETFQQAIDVSTATSSIQVQLNPAQ